MAYIKLLNIERVLSIRNFEKFYVRESSMGSIVFKFLPSRRMKDFLGYG